LLALAALAGCSDPAVEAASATNFHLAIDASNAANRLTNEVTSSGLVPTREERDTIRLHTAIALEHAELVTDRTLDRMHDDMPRIYRDAFVRGLRTVLQGLIDEDPRLLAEGHRHIDRWADWLEANAHEIQFPPRPATADSR
jgi:hypothetical protein